MAALFRLASAVAFLLMQVSSFEKYLVDTCMCQLDLHLFEVRLALDNNYDVPPTPTPPPPTTTLPPTPTAPPDAANATVENAIATPNERRKRAAEEPVLPEITENWRYYEGGAVFGPKGQAVFNHSVAIVDDVGVLYDEYYRPQMCACTNGSTAVLSFCLTNKMHTSEYENPTSAASERLTADILPWLSNTFLLNINQLFLRALPLPYTKMNQRVQANFQIILRTRLYKPEHYVKTGFETTEIRNGKFKINGAPYTTDIDNTNCYRIKDTTPALPKPASVMEGLRWVFFVAAVGMVAVLIFVTCVGTRDKFYIRNC